MSRFLLAAILALSFPVSSYGAIDITLDSVSGHFGGDTVQAGHPVRFVFRMNHSTGSGDPVVALTNGFEIYEKNGGNFYPAVGDTIPEFRWGELLDLGFFIDAFSVTGTGCDTIGFRGAALINGVPDGTSAPAWYIETGSDFDGDTLCIDSTYLPPHHPWVWYWDWLDGPLPGWYGPHCFHVFECCVGARGDADRQGDVNVADLAFLVNYLFRSGARPACSDEADVDGSGGIDVGDLTYLVAYLFLFGPPPPPCP